MKTVNLLCFPGSILHSYSTYKQGLETALGRTHFYLKSSDKITCINRVPVSGESKI